MTKGKTGMAQNDFCGQRIQLHKDLISTDSLLKFTSIDLLQKGLLQEEGKGERVKESSSLSPFP
jgi:hypothetical protein